MDDKGRTNHSPPPPRWWEGVWFIFISKLFFSNKNIAFFPSRSKTLFRGNYFFAQIWEANYSLKKNTPPPPGIKLLAPNINCRLSQDLCHFHCLSVGQYKLHLGIWAEEMLAQLISLSKAFKYGTQYILKFRLSLTIACLAMSSVCLLIS